jgi:general secretion pathway protein C
VTRLHPGHAILAALALAVLLLGWRALAAALAPLPEAPPFAAPALADRALLARFDPFFPAAAASGDALPVTALPFSLHGVRADSATGRGSAIIAAGDGEQKVYGVGDALGDGVTLAAIAGDHIVLDRAGTREALWLDNAGGGAPPVTDAGAVLAATAQGAPGSAASDPTEDAPPSIMPGDEALAAQATAEARGSAAGGKPE